MASTLVTCRKLASTRTIDTNIRSKGPPKGIAMSSSSSHGLGVKPAKATLADLENMIADSPSSDRVCLKLAQILRVRRSEVALLRLEKASLRFIFPPELRSAGVLPLSGSAVAARTAATRSPLLSNTFMRVKHVSLFEAVKLGVNVDEDDQSQQQLPIQKIMSVPIARTGENVIRSEEHTSDLQSLRHLVC